MIHRPAHRPATDAHSDPMIAVEGLSFRYPRQDRFVLKDVGFTVPRGSVFCILGPNGRGKTTLLKALLGLVAPSAGTVRLAGTAGYVPQGLGAPFAYSVLDMVVMGRARKLGAFRAPGKADYAAARRALARLGFSAFADRPVTALSGGERQMVMIARALAAETPLLVLDEPTSALDFRNQDRVLVAVARVAREDGLTVVFTSHQPQHALHVADRALALHGPEDHRHGPIDTVLTERDLTDLYGLPIRGVSVDHGGRLRAALVPVFSDLADRGDGLADGGSRSSRLAAE